MSEGAAELVSMEFEGQKGNSISDSSSQACTLNHSGSSSSNNGSHSAFSSSLSSELSSHQVNEAHSRPVSSINDGEEVDGHTSFGSIESPQKVLGHGLDM
jgi:hypothetical protein